MPKAAAKENEAALAADYSAAALHGMRGRVVVISGGGSGIGAMLAAGFVSHGANVYIFSRKSAAPFAAELSARGPGTCTALKADLQDDASLVAAVATITEREGKVHVLINNAGTNFNATLEETPPKAFDKVVQVNLNGIFRASQLFLPLLTAAAEDGSWAARIINISSIAGLEPPVLMDTYAYSSTKAAVLMLTRHMASRLGPQVLVNALCPGPFRSRMMRGTLAGDGEAATIGSTLLKRLGAPQDIFGAALLLASPAGSYMTGVALPVDGGSMLCRL